MDEKIQVDFEALDQQAKLHQQFSTAFQDVITAFNNQHDIIVSSLPANYAGTYGQWWEDFKTYLQHNADLHEQLEIYLQRARDGYSTNELNIRDFFLPKSSS